jgi:hypothetical protein
MLVKLEGVLKGSDLSVVAGLRPGHWGEHLNPEEGLLVRLEGCGGLTVRDARRRAPHHEELKFGRR